MARTTYSVSQLAELAQVSVRTLHYYEQIGLLEPKRLSNGYRSYGEPDVARLRQVLAMRACGMSLAQVRELLDEAADGLGALERHLSILHQHEQQIQAEIAQTCEAIRLAKGEKDMADTEKFAAIKRAAVQNNEERFGAEARKLHGDAAVDAANERLLAMDEQTWNSVEALEEEIKAQLVRAMQTDDPASPEAAELARTHARWIKLHWGEGAYSTEAHLGLAHGYLADQRFVDYYDSACGDGATEFLVSALESALAP